MKNSLFGRTQRLFQSEGHMKLSVADLDLRSEIILLRAVCHSTRSRRHQDCQTGDARSR